jgi:peptidoglycan/LPS O-acetylase OafA/YrhL
MGLIRILLALAVALVHIGGISIYSGIDTMMAVQCFYAISGFLIALAWDKTYSRQSNSLRLFYTNRAARIFFLYWTVLFLSLAVGVLLFSFRGEWPDYMVVNPHLPLQLILYEIISNVSLVGSSVALWLAVTPDGALQFTSNFQLSSFPVWRLLTLAPAWTLELELWFYALAPFLLRLRLKWIVGIAAASFAARLTCYELGYSADPWNYRFFPFEIGVFLLGGIAYRATKSIVWPRWISIFVFAITALSVGIYIPSFFPANRFIYLALFAATLPMIFNLTNKWPIDRFLADMSFPLYLVHWPVMLLVRDLLKPFPAWQVAVPTLLSVVAAAALVIFVERPIDRWRKGRIRKAASNIISDNDFGITSSARPAHQVAR